MKKIVRLGAILSLAILSACGPSKVPLTYFEDITAIESGNLGAADYKLKIVPDDRLAISVMSTNPAASMIFNLPSTAPVTDPVSGNISYQGAPEGRVYLVSSDGDITFPVLGKVHVAGLTTEEIAALLTNKISEDVQDPIVTVRLQNFHVNILGEVNKPGPVSATGERFSVLDAIARAGDISQYGVRENVLLIRENNGKLEYHHLNLRDASLFASPYYYLQQNDILYVQPNDVKRGNATYNVNNGYRIQVASAVISACSVIASLVIALAIK